jgi:hypothetical protein
MRVKFEIMLRESELMEHALCSKVSERAELL